MCDTPAEQPHKRTLTRLRRILADAKQKGVGQTYLIQHSAGSGKSNSITWLAYQLVEQYNSAGTANLFDSVVVITDRRVLDTQLKDNIKLFSFYFVRRVLWIHASL